MYAVVLLALSYIGYSVQYYLSNVENVEEYEVCVENKCIKTFHVHADINFELCGENMMLPLEKGPLEGPHTHKERNYIHFHERLPFEHETGKLLDTRPLTLNSFMNALEIRFNEECVANYCNNDLCPSGKPGMVRMYVNDVPNSEFERYVWKDKDDILITFK